MQANKRSGMNSGAAAVNHGPIERAMSDPVSLNISIPNFDEGHYLESSTKAKAAVESGEADGALEHYLRVGVDENRYSLIRREPTALTGAAERFLVSESGFCLLSGWLADEGCDPPRYQLLGDEFTVEFPAEVTFR